MTTLSRKLVVAGATAATLCALTAATVSPAEARGGWGGPFAAGVIGGAALGAIAAGAATPYYYGPPPVAYAPACWFTRRATYDYDGRFLGYQRVRVCR